MKSAMESSPSELQIRSDQLGYLAKEWPPIQLLEIEMPCPNFIGELIEVTVCLLEDDDMLLSFGHADVRIAGF